MYVYVRIRISGAHSAAGSSLLRSLTGGHGQGSKGAKGIYIHKHIYILMKHFLNESSHD